MSRCSPSSGAERTPESGPLMRFQQDAFMDRHTTKMKPMRPGEPERAAIKFERYPNQ
jgi:hypothetical protein